MVEQCSYSKKYREKSRSKRTIKKFRYQKAIKQSTNIRRYFVLNCTYKMIQIVNKVLLAGDEFMPEMYLKQPGFTYSACGPFTKNKQRIRKFKETGDTSYIYKNELDKACFQHDMAYGDFKDLAKRTASYKILRDNAINIVKNPKYNGYRRGLASMVYKFFDKKSTGGGIANNDSNNNKNKKIIIIIIIIVIIIITKLNKI